MDKIEAIARLIEIYMYLGTPEFSSLFDAKKIDKRQIGIKESLLRLAGEIQELLEPKEPVTGRHGESMVILDELEPDESRLLDDKEMLMALNQYPTYRGQVINLHGRQVEDFARVVEAQDAKTAPIEYQRGYDAGHEADIEWLEHYVTPRKVRENCHIVIPIDKWFKFKKKEKK